MPVYAKKTTSKAKIFQDRETIISSANRGVVTTTRIPVPNDIVLCNGCNRNVEEGYLVYLGKRELQQDRPYDVYCGVCLRKYFPKAIMV